MRKVTATFIVVLGLGAGIMFGETIKNAFGVESGGKENITQTTTLNEDEKQTHNVEVKKDRVKKDRVKKDRVKKDRVKNTVETSTKNEINKYNTAQENWDKVEPFELKM